MAQALGIGRLSAYILGNNHLGTEPAWLVGRRYFADMEGADAAALQAELDQLLRHYSNLLYISYRRGFHPMGATAQLTSDAGWGCTLRSGQMALVQALLYHFLGASTIVQLDKQPQELLNKLAEIVNWLYDSPGDQHPFSVHNLCSSGRTYGIIEGAWLGPYACCRAIEAARRKSTLSQLQSFHVIVAQNSGGLPIVYRKRVLEIFSEDKAGHPGVLLMLPATLGINQVNDRYHPAIRKLLSHPSSLGLIGGRPSSSVYCCGRQADTLICMDPHTVQDLGSYPEASGSYHPRDVKLVGLSSLDPSMALVFYCGTCTEAEQLLEALGSAHVGQEGALQLVQVEDEEQPEVPQSVIDDMELQEEDDEWQILEDTQ